MREFRRSREFGNATDSGPLASRPSKQSRRGATLDPDDVLERAAILEFCHGLPREAADAQALAEAGFSAWHELALALSRSDADGD